MRIPLLLLTIFYVSGVFGHTDTTGQGRFIFRGTEFTKIFSRESGTPFLDMANNGWVVYYGVRYDRVPLQYDLEDDQLVSIDQSGTIRMQLVKQKISAFGVEGRRFVRLPDTDLFYEQIYGGEHLVLIRWQKAFTRTGTEEGKYKLYKSYHISNGSETIEIQRLNDLYKYFGEHSRDLKEQVREQDLSFKKDPGKALVVLVGYADKMGYHGH